MGVLSDLIVAPASAKQTLLETPPENLPYHRVDVKGINQVHLHSLHSILFASNASSMDPTYFGDSTSTALTEDGPWVFEVPMVLVQELAAMHDTSFETVSQIWAQTDEFARDPQSPEYTRYYLQSLCEMAQAAVELGYALFLWISL